MGDWALIALRWVLYADLSLLFGLPLLFVLIVGQGRGSSQRLPLPLFLAGLAGTGIVTSFAGFVWQAAAMAGATPLEIDRSLLWTLVVQTSLGWALIARIGSLVLVLVVLAVAKDNSRGGGFLTVALGALALATLAWSGHGAAGEGVQGWIHLGADIIHLLAAGAWLGALVCFIWLIAKSWISAFAWSEMTHRALATFATTGTVLVGLLVTTGAVNFYFIVGFGSLATAAVNTYGQLLLLKLTLFAAMLVLAAANRFRLTPALGAASSESARILALRNLRKSLVLELSLGLAVIALVAWFGTLSPQGAS